MLRGVLAVVVSLIAMAGVVLLASLSLWFIFGVGGVLRPGTFDATPLSNAAFIAIGLFGAALGGWLCATISRSYRAVAVFGGLCLVMGLLNTAAQHSKPDPGPRNDDAPGTITVTRAVALRKEPAWFTLLMPIVGAPTAWIAGRATLNRSAQTGA